MGALTPKSAGHSVFLNSFKSYFFSHLPKVENGLNYDHKPLKIYILLSQRGRREGYVPLKIYRSAGLEPFLK